MNVTSSNPEITIGILCYNAENTIQQAIKCALEQNYQAFEIIIVDDASTDSSHSKIKPFLGSPRIRFIQHITNKGQGMARNSVINAARGEFVAFFDDDDVSDPQRLKIQKDTIVSNEVRFGTVKVACYASGCRVYPNGYVVKSHAIGSVGNTPPNGIGVAKYLLAFDRKKIGSMAPAHQHRD